MALEAPASSLSTPMEEALAQDSVTTDPDSNQLPAQFTFTVLGSPDNDRATLPTP
jgi:hypothetical protein